MREIKNVIDDDNLDFHLIFKFEKNEFFENLELKKIFHVSHDDENEHPELSTGTKINWKEGKNVCVKIK